MNSALISGLALMAVGMMLIPVGDALARVISGFAPYSPGFLAWSRFAVGTVLVAPLALQHIDRRTLSRDFLFRQAVRACLIAATITLIIRAVTLSPLPDVFGAFFVGPALAVILASWLLKERASTLEWIAVLLGFIGVLMVVQPTGEPSPGLKWAMAAGVCYAGFLVATRWAAASGPPVAQLWAQLLIGALVLLPFAAGDLRMQGVVELPLLICMGITSAVANLCSILALKRAGAAWLAPVVYLQIVAASLIGVLYFGDEPGWLTIAGLIVIVAAGLLRMPVKRQAV